MNRLFLLFLLLISFLFANANPIDRIKAFYIAERIIGDKEPICLESANNVKARSYTCKEFAPYYVFNVGKNDGFIIVSGDDDFPRIVGYSDNGTFDTAKIHPGLAGFLDSYANYIEDYINGRTEAPYHSVESIGQIIIPALCETTWDQTFPFNYYCPRYNNKKCYVGCLATAMSQIMYYWKWPNSGRGKIDYESSDISQIFKEDLSINIYEWSKMKKTANSGVIKLDAQQAMGLIGYNVGLSVGMQYGTSDGSGAFIYSAPLAFVNNFSYKASTMHLYQRDCFSSEGDWLKMLKQELNARRPVLYTGVSSSGGHAFIVDGYDSNNLLHVNWGWGGSCDGFYDLTLIPEGNSSGFSKSQSVVVGIEPDEFGIDTVFAQQSIYMVGVSTDTATFDREQAFEVKIDAVSNYSYFYRALTFDVGLYDCENNLLEPIESYMDPVFFKFNPISNVYAPRVDNYMDVSINCKIPSQYLDGKYGLRIITEEKGSDEWILPETFGGDKRNWIPIVINKGTVSLNDADGPSDPSGVLNISASGQIASVKYFNINGYLMPIPIIGSIVIGQETYFDGTIKRYKFKSSF